jgi:small subunit ribosomal protein S3
MGHKVHPYGFRLGVSRTWTAKWYADKDYTTLLKEDISIRKLVDKRLANASVSQVEIERGINHVTVTVHTAKPGIVIGKGGQNVEILRQQIGALTNRKVKLEIKEIRQPELDAYLVAMNIAQPPDRLPQGDEAGHPANHEGRRQGRQDHGRRAAGRLRDGPPRVGQGRPDPPRHAPRRHQLRLGPRPYDVWPDRGQGLDLPRRHHPRADAAAGRRRGRDQRGRGRLRC